MIMAICDRVISSKDGSKDCLRSITKRLNHQDPHVVMQAIVVSTLSLFYKGQSIRDARATFLKSKGPRPSNLLTHKGQKSHHQSTLGSHI